MVEMNDLQFGINTRESEIYFRLLNDFRISVENILLEFIDWLHQFDTIDSEQLNSELDYLNFLCARYHKNELNLKINSKKNEKVDSFCKIIKNTRKTIDYCLLDFVDFSHKNSLLLEETKINKSLAIILKQKSKEYYKILPKKLSRVPSEKKFRGGRNSKKITKDVPEIFEKLLNSIDLEFLKVYDYLIETDLEKINSFSLYSLIKELKIIGRKYNKIDFEVRVYNNPCCSRGDIFIEETCKNLMRLGELKRTILS